MNRAFTTTLAQIALVLAALPSQAQAWPDAPPNLVQATATIFTSGQPPAKSLEGLKAQGFEAVVYLAPPTVQDAVRDEGKIVGSQGIVFVNIPIVFDKPSERDFETFAAVMKALEGRKVLVHCQVNLRASTMTFLYRAIVLKESPDEAWKAVERIWTPKGPWKRLVDEQLKRHGIAFEIF
ncbi:MAG: protein tyrosine phosphatase family protein [Burkholderiales bacterium]|nr:protein tyrosine phosphatase family protein [Burkholderiales bacterium]